jgi:hypothetical protein
MLDGVRGELSFFAVFYVSIPEIRSVEALLLLMIALCISSLMTFFFRSAFFFAKAGNDSKHRHETDRGICKNDTYSCYCSNHGKPRTQKGLDGLREGINPLGKQLKKSYSATRRR